MDKSRAKLIRIIEIIAPKFNMRKYCASVALQSDASLYCSKAEAGGGLHHKFIGRFIIVFDHTIEYCFTDGIFQLPHHSSRRKVEFLHDYFSRYGRLPVADLVFLLHLLQTKPHHLEVLQVAPDFLAVLGRYIRFAKHHQRVDIVTCIEKQAADSRVRNVLLR